jgi:hypothetical protein
VSLAFATPSPRAVAAPELAKRKSHNLTAPSLDAVTNETGPPPGPPDCTDPSGSSLGAQIAFTRDGCAPVIVITGFVGGARLSYATTSPPSHPRYVTSSHPACATHITLFGASNTPLTAPVSAEVIVNLCCATVTYDDPLGVNTRSSGFTRSLVLCATRPLVMFHIATHESAPAVMATFPDL